MPHRSPRALMHDITHNIWPWSFMCAIFHFHTKLTFSGNVPCDRFWCPIFPPYELVFGRICNLGITACHQIVTRCSDGFLTHVLFLPQGCMDKHRVMGILRQMEKFLKGQEIRFTEGLRIMKSKLTNLQNSLSKLPQADQSSCKCHNTWHIHLVNGLCECEVKCTFILTYCFHIEQVCVKSLLASQSSTRGHCKTYIKEYERWKSAGFRFESSTVIVL